MKKKTIALLGTAGLLALTACSAEAPLSQREYDQAFTQRLKEHAYSQCSLTGEHEGLEVCSDQQKKNAASFSDTDFSSTEYQIAFVEGGLPDVEGTRPIDFSRVDHSHNVLDPSADGLEESAEGVRVYAQQTSEELFALKGNFFQARDNVDFYHLIRDNIYYVYIGESESETKRTLDNPTGKELTQKSIDQQILDYGPQDLYLELRKFKEVDGEIFEVKEREKLEYYAKNWSEAGEKISEDYITVRIDKINWVRDFLPFGVYGKPGPERSLTNI